MTTDTTGRYAPMPEPMADLTYDGVLLTVEQAMSWIDATCALRAAQPIDMILYCPNCGAQHVDKPEGQFYPGHTAEESAAVNKDHGLWDNPPHRSHLCHACGCIWRPADVPTNGVESIKTEGKADTWLAHSEVNAQAAKRDPISAQAQAIGIPFCCGKDERQTDEIAKLRNVVQAAMFVGIPKVFESWNYHFPDDKREVPQAAQRPQADAEWLAELRRLADLYGTACIHSLTSGSDEAVADEDVRLNALMAHAAQRPADINGLTATDVVSQNSGDMSSNAEQDDMAAFKALCEKHYEEPWSLTACAMRVGWQAALASRPVPPPISDASLEEDWTMYGDDSKLKWGPALLGYARAIIAARDAQWKGGV